MKPRVIICEKSDVVAMGLTDVLESQCGYQVVARMDSAEMIGEKVLSLDVDLVIVNPRLLGSNVQDFLSRLRGNHPGLHVVAYVDTCYEMNVLKRFDASIEIYDSVTKILSKLETVMEHEEERGGEELSPREMDVLVLIAKGMMNKEISDTLNISIHTVITHRKNITRKTGIKSVSGLTVYALLNNLLSIDEC